MEKLQSCAVKFELKPLELHRRPAKEVQALLPFDLAVAKSRLHTYCLVGATKALVAGELLRPFTVCPAS